jgi:uncharacterized protein YabN with tetrapyrrole methylase and pyrophosphatase domain
MDIRDMLLKTASELDEAATFLEQIAREQEVLDKSKEAGFDESDVDTIIGKLGDNAFEAVNLAVEAVARNKQASLGNPTLFNSGSNSGESDYSEYDRILLNGGF